MKPKKIGSQALKIVQGFFPQVTSVQDAANGLKAEVTVKDDKNSRLKNHAECAFAVACKRKMHADGVIISVKTAYIIKGKKAIRYRVPESTAREVVSFDRNGGFAPGVYALKAPNRGERLGETNSGDTHNQSNRRKPKFRHQTTGIRTSLLKT